MVRRATRNWRASAEMFGRSLDLPTSSKKPILAVEPVGRAAEQFLHIDTARAFQGFKLPHHFSLAALLQSNFHSVLEFVDVHRFGKAIMGATRPLQGFHLLLHFQRAGDDDDGNKGQQFLEFRQEVQAEFALGQHMVENQKIGRVRGDLCERFTAILHANQFVAGQRFLVDFILEVVVLNDQDGGWVHGNQIQGWATAGKFRTGRMRVNMLPWFTTDSTAKPASICVASS